MKKTITLIMMSMLFYTGIAFAQDLSLIVNGEEVKNGATIYYGEVVDENPSGSPVYKCDPHIGVKNNTAKPVEATVTAVLSDQSNNCLPSYCGFGTDLCMPIQMGMPIPRTTTVEAGEILATLIYASPIMDITNFYAKIEVTLSYGENSLTVHVVLAPPSSIVAPEIKSTYVSQYGNLVSLNFNFTTDAERILNVYDITGRKVKQMVLTNNTGVIQLPASPKGIYLYSVTENGSLKTSGKYIVK